MNPHTFTFIQLALIGTGLVVIAYSIYNMVKAMRQLLDEAKKHKR